MRWRRTEGAEKTLMLRQVLAVTALNLRTVPQRFGTSMVIVVGIGGVVGVLVALLAMAAGFKATLASTGRPDRVILLRGGANDELSSVMTVETATIVKDLPGIKKDAEGRPIAIAERYVLSDVKRRGTSDSSNVVVRGTTPDVIRVRPETKIIAGRMFEPGKREVVVGAAALDQYEGLDIGKSVEVRDGGWPVVGVFSTGGDVHESEIWVDVSSLHAVLRQPAYANVTAQLEDASNETFQAFKDRVTTDPRLNLSVQREPDYYSSRSEALEKFIKGLGYVVAVIMGIGAFFGALNTMYAAISARTTEIATLRAIGFSGAPVLISVLVESLVLAAAGGVVGAGIAYVLFNGFTVSTLNFQTFSQVAFSFRVTPQLLLQGLIWAITIGLLGALLPGAKYSGDIRFRYWAVLIPLALVFTTVLALIVASVKGASFAMMVAGIGLGVRALVILIGNLVFKTLIDAKVRGRISSLWPKVGFTALFVLLIPILSVFVCCFLWKVIWVRDLETLFHDPILDGLRQA